MPYAAKLAGLVLGDPLPVLGWKPYARRQLVYDLGFRKLAIVNDQPMVETILFDRAGQFPKSAIVYELLRPLIGEGVFGQPGGDTVKETRRLMARALAAVSEERVAAVTTAIATRYMDRWLVEGPVSAVGTDFSRMTVDIVSECTMGTCFDEGESRRFTELFAIYHRRAKPVLLMLGRDTQPVRRAIVRDLGLEPVGAEMRALIRGRFLGSDGVKGKDAPFREALERAGLLSGGRSERALDEIAVMLLAGHETTASTLSWLAYELAGRPELQEAAASALSGEGTMAGQGIDAVVAALTNETLRLYPPIGFFLRDNTADVALDEADIATGSLVLVAPRTLHRHRDYWNEPDAFQPERWFGPPPARGSFVPFGMGARACPGARFASIELATITQLLLARLRLQRTAAKTPQPLWNLTSRPDPDVVLAVEPRQHPARQTQEIRG